MILKKIIKLLGFMMLFNGLFNLFVGFSALLSIDISQLLGRDLGLMQIAIDYLKKDLFLNGVIVISGYYLMSWGMATLSDKPQKKEVEININYKVLSIDVDSEKSIVTVKLKDPFTNEEFEIQRKTNYINYFKDYVKLNGDIMPGSIATTI